MSRRSERVSEAIRREASLLIKDEVRDPRIGFVTVTKATITEDLRNAVIYYSVLGDDKAKSLAKKGLSSAVNYMKTELGHRIKLRYTPDIRFKEDKTFEHAERIEAALKKIKEEKMEDRNAH